MMFFRIIMTHQKNKEGLLGFFYEFSFFKLIFQKKNRCDRIMIWPNEDCIVKQYFYNRKESKLSDHRFQIYKI